MVAPAAQMRPGAMARAPQRVQLRYGVGSRAIHREKCLL